MSDEDSHMTRCAVFDADNSCVSRVVPAVNFGPRKGVLGPTILLMHYTGMASAEKAIQWLACEESQVSCHYVVDEAGQVTQLVREADRAWHAGKSHWRGITDVNSASIGIEIQNPGHEDGYHDFPLAQMQAVCDLSREIIARHHITPQNVIAHSDIAPGRKIDPGEKFDWKWLHARGVGHWVAPVPVDAADSGFDIGDVNAEILEVQKKLAAYGYGVGQTSALDRETWRVVRAFQRHFRPERVDGRLDRSTILTLDRLIEDCLPQSAATSAS